MEYTEYKREIELMKRQNYTEYDMYSVIAQLLREGNNMKELSLRDVSKRWGRSKKGRVFYGLSGIPDFAVLDEKFENSDNWMEDIDKVYGCVEIKGIDYKELLKIESINIESGIELSLAESQLLGEILWYKKVLYTNGLVWKFIEWESDENTWENIKNILKDRIDAENEKEEESIEWYKNDKLDLKKILKKVKEETIIEINVDTSDEDWKKFLKQLYKINW